MLKLINETVQTSTNAHTVERFVRTFKYNLYRILDSLKQDKTNWIKHIDNIINKQNSTEHSVTQIKPTEAGNKENHLWINWHLQNAAKKNRKHPDIKDGDMVIYKLKPSIGIKSHEPKWSSTRHRIVDNSIDNQYYIPSVAVENRKTKLWMRHELLKV